MRRIIFVLTLVSLLFVSPSAQAADRGLQIRPLSYETTLQPDERQQGVVDISNPSDEPVKVRVSVSAFRETDDGIEFYNDPKVNSGIRTDYTNLTLQGKEAFRLVFEANAAKLPSGKVRAAVLFTTEDESNEMVAQRVSVGTLLLIDNKQPAPTSVEVEDDGFGRIVLIGAVAGLVLAAVVELVRRLAKKLALKRSN